MKTLCTLLLLALAISSCKNESVNFKKSTVSFVIGDESFIQTYGFEPTASTDYTLRIQTHLKYVEALLRNKDVSHLSPELRKKRSETLDHLKAYWEAGIFPVNSDYALESRPCFIDDAGRICAVGYLVEQSAGRALAEAINQQAQYDLLLEMDIPALDEWIKESGFEKEELAMVQPAYYNPGPVGQTKEVVDQEYGMFSILFGMTNSTLSGVNIYQMQHKELYHSKRLAWFGIGFGAGQTAWGILGMPKTPDDRSVFKKTTTISWLNIGMGTGTMLISGTNLVLNKKLKEKQLSFHFYAPQVSTNNCAYGLGFIKQF